jgi:uracil-DNA glycosylase
VVPLDVGSKVFIIGAYPSARFGVMGGKRDVPMADNLGPFEPERYFDGERVRLQNSAAELDKHYLVPLGVRREECWITDLVKVFLFKDGTGGSTPT